MHAPRNDISKRNWYENEGENDTNEASKITVKKRHRDKNGVVRRLCNLPEMQLMQMHWHFFHRPTPQTNTIRLSDSKLRERRHYSFDRIDTDRIFCETKINKFKNAQKPAYADSYRRQPAIYFIRILRRKNESCKFTP